MVLGDKGCHSNWIDPSQSSVLYGAFLESLFSPLLSTLAPEAFGLKNIKAVWKTNKQSLGQLVNSCCCPLCHHKSFAPLVHNQSSPKRKGRDRRVEKGRFPTYGHGLSLNCATHDILSSPSSRATRHSHTPLESRSSIAMCTKCPACPPACLITIRSNNKTGAVVQWKGCSKGRKERELRVNTTSKQIPEAITFSSATQHLE